MLHITSFKDLDAIIEVAVKLEIPQSQPLNFYGTEVTFRYTHNFLKNLGSSGLSFVNLKVDGEYPVFADVIKYGGYTFHLIYVDKIIEQSAVEIKKQ